MLSCPSLLQPNRICHPPVRSLRKSCHIVGSGVLERLRGQFGSHIAPSFTVHAVELSRGPPFRSPEYRPTDPASTGARRSSIGSESHPAHPVGRSFGSCLALSPACRPRRLPNFPPRPARRCSD